MSFGWDASTDLWDLLSGGSGQLNRSALDEASSTLAQFNVDWQETDDAHIFTAHLPGVKKEEVKVNVEDGNVLEISGEKVEQQEKHSDASHRVERRSGTFSRRFRLPENAETADIKCRLDDGVLNVVVPKNRKNVRNIDVA